MRPALASRNIYRGSPRAFASDGQALRWAAELQDSGAARQLTVPARLFSIMPFMHSEETDLQVWLSSKPTEPRLCCPVGGGPSQFSCLPRQERGIDLFQEFLRDLELLDDAADATDMVAKSLEYAKAHLAVIKQWGRYPHRNEVLGRASTPEEEKGMKEGTIPRF